MSSFVDECRKEWSRLGVPEAEANEMAADLEADLAEAKAEGVSPEEVLGNGYFDPRSFAASWAAARGFVRPARPARGTIQVRTLALALGAVVAAAFVALGLAFLFGTPVINRSMSAAAAPFALHRHPLPPLFVNPSGRHPVDFGTMVPPSLQPAGLVLLLLGLAGPRAPNPEDRAEAGEPDEQEDQTRQLEARWHHRPEDDGVSTGRGHENGRERRTVEAREGSSGAGAHGTSVDHRSSEQ